MLKFYTWTCLSCGHTYTTKKFDAPCPECGGVRAISANTDKKEKDEEVPT